MVAVTQICCFRLLHVTVCFLACLQSGVHARFFQVFYLAPQEKGYYVLNDLLRISSVPQTQNDTASHASHAPLANGRPAKVSNMLCNVIHKLQDGATWCKIDGIVHELFPQAQVTKQQEVQQPAVTHATPAPETSAQSSAATAATAASHAQPSPPRKAQPAATSPGPQSTSSWASLLKQQADKQSASPAPQPAAALPPPAAAAPHAKPPSPGPDTAAAPAEAPAGATTHAADLPPAAPRTYSATPSTAS